VEYNLEFGANIETKTNTLIMGQISAKTGKVEGICRQVFAMPNGHVYEG